jgi:DNA-binding MarR family transcriptional regulator
MKESVSHTDIANATGTDLSTIAEMVERLVKRGWLQRRRSIDDARYYAVRITATGRKALKFGEKASLGVDGKVLAAMPVPLAQAGVC